MLARKKLANMQQRLNGKGLVLIIWEHLVLLDVMLHEILLPPSMMDVLGNHEAEAPVI